MGFAYKRELILKKIEARRDVVPLSFLNYSIYHNAHYIIKSQASRVTGVTVYFGALFFPKFSIIYFIYYNIYKYIKFYFLIFRKNTPLIFCCDACDA